MILRRSLLKKETGKLTAVTLVAGLALTGCSTFGGVGEVMKEQGTPADGIIILEARKNAIDDETDGAEKARMRDDLQDQIIRYSVVACNEYLRGIASFDKTSRLVLNSISMIAGGVAPLFSGGATESLAVTSGLATGAQAEMSQTIFQEKAFGLVDTAVKQLRKAKYTEIKASRENADISKYGVEQALKDAAEYHTLCSLRDGLEAIGANIKETPETKAELQAELDGLEARIKTTEDNIALGMDNGSGTLVPVIGDQRDDMINQNKRDRIRVAEIRALLPYAR